MYAHVNLPFNRTFQSDSPACKVPRYREETIARPFVSLIRDNVIIEIASNQDWPYQPPGLMDFRSFRNFDFRNQINRITLIRTVDEQNCVIDIYVWKKGEGNSYQW